MSFHLRRKAPKKPRQQKKKDRDLADPALEHVPESDGRHGENKKTDAPAVEETGQASMTSITSKLLSLFTKRKAARTFFQDLLFFFGMTGSWLLSQEQARLGTISFHVKRTFLMPEGWKSLVYQISDRKGTQLLLLPCQPYATVLSVCAAVILVLQVVTGLAARSADYYRIRLVLSPINEIAIKADELSRMTFSDEKYHVIEDAIANIRPGEETRLDFGDEDLTGVEAAMNNLLIRMRETYRQQARFVNDASHELRTPIAVIEGYANMLDRWGKSDEKILQESILAIRNESAHMKHLVEQLLFLARGDSGRMRLETVEADLGDVMQEIYEQSLLIDEAHTYRFSREPGPLTACVDVGLIRQAVRILVDNAAKYTPEGKEIRLSCEAPGETEICLQVQDAGIGMEEKDIAHMFERFYRSDEVRSYMGTGLGLSIAKWIVDRHRGHFEVLSRAGLGTRIRVILPRK